MDLDAIDFLGNHRRKDELSEIIRRLPPDTFDSLGSSAKLEARAMYYSGGLLVSGVEICRKGSVPMEVNVPEGAEDVSRDSKTIRFRYNHLRYKIIL